MALKADGGSGAGGETAATAPAAAIAAAVAVEVELAVEGGTGAGSCGAFAIDAERTVDEEFDDELLSLTDREADARVAASCWRLRGLARCGACALLANDEASLAVAVAVAEAPAAPVDGLNGWELDRGRSRIRSCDMLECSVRSEGSIEAMSWSISEGCEGNGGMAVAVLTITNGV